MARVSSSNRASGNRSRKLATAAPQIAGRSPLSTKMHGPAVTHLGGFAFACLVGMALILFLKYINTAPMVASNGVIFPIGQDGTKLDRQIQPGDRVQIEWDQTWKQFCPVKVTPTLKGADGFPKAAEPVTTGPPTTLGMRHAERVFIFPILVEGNATYRAILEPECFLDKIYQRRFQTPELEFQVMAVRK